jgi:hypothetical protein
MIRLFVVTFALLVLVGCGVSPEQRERVKSVLPDGCKILELGEYGQIDAVLSELVVVICNGRQTVSTNTYEKHGKTHRTSVAVSIF